MEYYKNLDLADIKYFCEFDQIDKIEEWKYIDCFDNFYAVSDLGRIKSFKKCRGKNKLILSQSVARDGYLIVSLSLGNIRKTYKTHKIVSTEFLNHIPCGMSLVINHKNFNKLDNRKLNLEITTSRKNTDKKHIKHTSEFTGVSWDNKDKVWRAQIISNKKVIYLGSFKEEKEASQYYQDALKSIESGSEIMVKRPVFYSKHKGISYNKRYKKWYASVYVDRKYKFVGAYLTEELAYLALQEYNKK